MTSLLFIGKIKASALSGKIFQSYSDRQQEEQNNRFCTVPSHMEKKLQVLV